VVHTLSSLTVRRVGLLLCHYSALHFLHEPSLSPNIKDHAWRTVEL
jgi:hypothetical protein